MGRRTALPFVGRRVLTATARPIRRRPRVGLGVVSHSRLQRESHAIYQWPSIARCLRLGVWVLLNVPCPL